jgi:hypothetical protein
LYQSALQHGAAESLSEGQLVSLSDCSWCSPRVTIPFATTRTKTRFGVRPTLEEWKEAFDRNIAPYVNANDRSTGIEPKSPADRLARNRRIAVQIREKRERVRACEMEVADTIRRLVSAEGGTEWEYDVRAGKVTVT